MRGCICGRAGERPHLPLLDLGPILQFHADLNFVQFDQLRPNLTSEGASSPNQRFYGRDLQLPLQQEDRRLAAERAPAPGGPVILPPERDAVAQNVQLALAREPLQLRLLVPPGARVIEEPAASVTGHGDCDPAGELPA